MVAEIWGVPLFAIQLDESSCGQLLVFECYIQDGDFNEEFLFCHALESTMKGVNVFREVSNLFRPKDCHMGQCVYMYN